MRPLSTRACTIYHEGTTDPYEPERELRHSRTYIALCLIRIPPSDISGRPSRSKIGLLRRSEARAAATYIRTSDKRARHLRAAPARPRASSYLPLPHHSPSPRVLPRSSPESSHLSLDRGACSAPVPVPIHRRSSFVTTHHRPRLVLFHTEYMYILHSACILSLRAHAGRV